MKCDGGALNYSFLLALLVIIQKWYFFSYSVSSTFMELPIICHCNNSFRNYIYKLENNFYLPFIKKVVLKMIEPLIIQNDMQVFH